MGLQPGTSDSPEMKTAGIVLLLATTCLAAPERPYVTGYYSDRDDDYALFITGGSGDTTLNYGRLSSVEFYRPGSNISCTDDYDWSPKTITGHTQEGLMQCGGWGSYQSCHTLNTDTAQWTKTHSLSVNRKGHSSWRRQDGSVLLIGGSNSKTKSETTTELVSDGSGFSTPGFTLKCWTNDACSITDTSSVVITGGGSAHSRVTRYDRNGWVEDLPSLLTTRYEHGCAMYITGGYDGDNYRDEIYKLNTKTMNWVEVARMKTPRRFHGLSVIKFSQVADKFCTLLIISNSRTKYY